MEFEVPTEKVKPHYTDDEIGDNPTWQNSGLERRRTNENGQNGNGCKKSYHRYPVSESEEPIPMGPIRQHNTSFKGFRYLNLVPSGQPSNGLGPEGPGPQATPDTAQSPYPEGSQPSFPVEQ